MPGAAELSWLKEQVGGSVVDFYAALGVGLTDRGGEEATVRCFANPDAHNRDDRSPSCSVNLLTGLWHCKGCGASGNPFHAAQRMGRSDIHASELAKSYGLFLEVERAKPAKLPGERELKKWNRDLRDNGPVLERIGVVKGWTLAAMVRCGLGWDGKRLVFPIRDPKHLKIVGVVRYVPGGKPKSLADKGSKRLLFPAPEVTSRRRPLFVVEGEPDAISVWSCGFQAVAVPGTGSWRHEWGMRLQNRQAVVLCDCDTPGRELSRRIADAIPKARVVEMDPFRDDGWDIGDVVTEATAEGGIWQAREVLKGLAFNV